MLADARFGRIVDPLRDRVFEPADLLARSERRMARFAALGVVRGARVFLHYGNRPEFFADLLAIWRLGACAVPIDGRLTAFEVETLARAGRPRVSVWEQAPESQLASALAGLGIAIAEVGEDEAAASARRAL